MTASFWHSSSFLLHFDSAALHAIPQVAGDTEATNLLGPLHNATTVLARTLQGEHPRRPALLFAVGRDPQVLGCKDTPAAMAAGGVGVHGWGGCRHQLVCHRSPWDMHCAAMT